MIFGARLLLCVVVIFLRRSKNEGSDEELFDLLPERSTFILDQFVAHHDIDDLTQHLMYVTVIIEHVVYVILQTGGRREAVAGAASTCPRSVAMP